MNHLNPSLMAAVGPRVRKSPLFDCTVRAGLSAVSTYNHMWLPMSYGDLEAEYERLTTGASIWDVTAQRHIEIVGPDADAVVQYVTITDTSEIRQGSAGYAPMVDHDGRLVNDPILLHLGRNNWRFSIADSDIRLWIDATRRSKGWSCSVTELDTATIAVQGPQAMAVGQAAGIEGIEQLEDFEHRSIDIGGVEAIVSRSGWSTQGGFEIFIDQPSPAPTVWDLLLAAGEPYEIGPAAPNAQERIENVLLSYGTDTGYDADPLELGLGEVADLDGHDFVGRDALLDIKEAGPSRCLLGVILAGDRLEVLPHPRPMTRDGEPIGQLRAAAWSPRFQANLGLALLDATVAVGETVTVDLDLEGSRFRNGRVVDLPFEDDDVTT